MQQFLVLEIEDKVSAMNDFFKQRRDRACDSPLDKRV
jgi:hypothetical protein